MSKGPNSMKSIFVRNGPHYSSPFADTLFQPSRMVEITSMFGENKSISKNIFNVDRTNERCE